MSEEISPEFEKKCNEHFHTMKDNTQINDEPNNLRFAKMHMSADHIDFIMDYYKLKNIPEVNQAAIYVLKTLAHMEKDGWKFAIFKTEIVDGKEKMSSESFGLDISDMIQSLLRKLNSDEKY